MELIILDLFRHSGTVVKTEIAHLLYDHLLLPPVIEFDRCFPEVSVSVFYHYD